MSTKDRHAQRVLCGAIIATAERKLGRRLTAGEQCAIEAISSLTLLESIAQGFAEPETTAEQIERDLASMMRK